MLKRILIVFLFVLSSAITVNTYAETADYNDIKNHWAKNQIITLSQNKIISGYNGHFRPNDNITHNELDVIINNIMNYPKDIGYNSLGSSTRDILSSSITREDAVVLISKLFGIEQYKEKTDYFADENIISSEALTYVSSMAEKGYLIGRGNQMFDPKSNITRAEVVTLINNIVKSFCDNKGIYSGTVNGTTIVNTTDTILQNMTLNGDLILSEGIGEGNATIINTTISGKVIVRGGGINSIKIEGTSTINELICEKTTGIVHIFADTNTTIAKTNIFDGKDSVILTGKFRDLAINTNNACVKLVEADIDNVELSVSNSELNIDSKSYIKQLVVAKSADNTKITGSGYINYALISGNNTFVDTNIFDININDDAVGTTNGIETIDSGKSLSLVQGLGFTEKPEVLTPIKTTEIKPPLLDNTVPPDDSSGKRPPRPSYSTDATLNSISVNSNDVVVSDDMNVNVNMNSNINISIKRNHNNSAVEYCINDGDINKLVNDTIQIDPSIDLPIKIKIVVTAEDNITKHEYVLTIQSNEETLPTFNITEFKTLNTANNYSKGIFCKWNINNVIEGLDSENKISSIKVSVYSNQGFIFSGESKYDMLIKKTNDYNNISFLLTCGEEFANRKDCEYWTYAYSKPAGEWTPEDIPSRVSISIQTDKGVITSELTSFNNNSICSIDTPCWNEIAEESKIYNSSSINEILDVLKDDVVCNVSLPQNITIEDNLVIPKNKTLVIPSSKTLTINTGFVFAEENGYLTAYGNLNGTGYISPESRENVIGDGVNLKVHDDTTLSTTSPAVIAFEFFDDTESYGELQFILEDTNNILNKISSEEVIEEVHTAILNGDKIMLSAEMNEESLNNLDELGINDSFVVYGNNAYCSENENWLFTYNRGGSSGKKWDAREKPNRVTIKIITNKSIYTLNQSIKMQDNTLNGWNMLVKRANEWNNRWLINIK